MKLSIKDKLTVTYAVDRCDHTQYNGTHTETFDLTSLTSDDIEQYLAQTLIIKRQAQLRGKGAVKDDGTSLKVGTWKVPAPGRRITTSPLEKATELLSKLTPEQRQALLSSLM